MVTRCSSLSLAVLVVLLAAPLRAGEPPALRGHFGAGPSAVTEFPVLPPGSGGPYERGIRIAYFSPDSPAADAGLVVGDIILRVDGEPLSAEGNAITNFVKDMRARAPGTTVRLLVLRQPLDQLLLLDGEQAKDPVAVLADVPAALEALKPGSSLELVAQRGLRVETVDVVLGTFVADRPAVRPVLSDEETHGHLLGEGSSQVERFADLAIAHYELGDDVADLRRRLSALHASDEGYRLDDVRFVHRNPWSMPSAAEDLLGALAGSAPDWRLADRLRSVAVRDRLDVVDYSFEPLPRGVSVDAHADALEALLIETSDLVAAAFEPLTEVEMKTVLETWPGISAALGEEGIYLHADSQALRRRSNLELLELAGKVERRYLFAAALSWARLTDPAWQRAMGQDLAGAELKAAPFILRRETPLGEIVFGGPGDDRYRGFEPALVVDVGGNDIYSGNAGSSLGPSRPASAVVDLAGDDAYESSGDAAQGAGILGVGLLVDVSGNDRYIGRDWVQGVGLLGIGVLIDEAGDDIRRGRRFAQAVGLWGAGFVLDASGDDRHEVSVFGQGLGLPGGFGVLHDRQGADHYHAKGGSPSSYGTQGVFDGWSQGVGLGFRRIQSGGIGILVDDAGADDYEAGNFSQGGGYYYGWGLLHDRGAADDVYIASRYGQGFSAHQALGTFFEDGGNDQYITRNAVIAGLAWDECVSWFHDRDGDDTYRAGGFSLGASAHNSLSVFIDSNGSDTYRGVAPARAGGNSYHGGTSLSLFLDLGKGSDRYDQGLPEKSIRKAGVHGIAADLPGPLGRNLKAGTFKLRAAPAED